MRFLARSLLFTVLPLALALAACGGDGDASAIPQFASAESASDFAGAPESVIEEALVPDFDFGEEFEDAADQAAAEAAVAAVAPGGGLAAEGADAAQITERKVINIASVSVAVESVASAVTQVRGIAESSGGFVEQLSRSGGADREQATLTIRVPQDGFFAALERIEALGDVLDEFVGSEDVTEQFIDLEARLRIAEQEEVRLLAVLDRVQNLTDVLTIERELARVRSQIEVFQGQLNFLLRRVDLATITVSLFPPEAPFVEPPRASLAVAVSTLNESVERVQALVASMDGVVDRVIITVDEEEESAFLLLRVPSATFERALATIEARGDVLRKEVDQRGEPSEAGAEPSAEPSAEPDAHIDLFLVEKEGSSDAGLIAAIVAPIGGVAIALALLAFLWRRSRTRAGG